MASNFHISKHYTAGTEKESVNGDVLVIKCLICGLCAVVFSNKN